ncbi:transmembrane protein 213 [Protopterus annectens]|uniref:transmembrane protein 213 n=1 Tax=Protopterus annectens TaxID=7888 RepID=UPI001CFAD1BF|nr:transmembrane protein 213 [Protopterus annectens]
MKGNCQKNLSSLLGLLFITCISCAVASSSITSTANDQCKAFNDNTNLCQYISKCCIIGMDENGWIAAAVGWGLWFLTMIILCIIKVSSLTPEGYGKQVDA